MDGTPPEVELVVPGAEGIWIARALSAEGFVVHATERPSDRSVTLRVVERSVPGALEALRRGRGRDSARLVLVGWEAAPERELEALRADSFYSRPVALPRLRRWARTLVGRPAPPPVPQPRGPLSSTPPAPVSALPPVPPPVRGLLSSTPPEPQDAWPAEDEPSAADAMDGGVEHGGVTHGGVKDGGVTDGGVTDGGVREPRAALQGPDSLGAEAEPGAHDAAVEARFPTVVLPEAPAAGALGEDLVRGPEQAATGPAPGGSVGSDVDPTTGAAHAFSPGIERLIRDADRRVFPEEAPLDLRFATGSEGPEELVPDDLLDPAEADGVAGPDPEPLDGLSIVAEAPPAPPAAPAGESASRVLPAGVPLAPPAPADAGPEGFPSLAPPAAPAPAPRREGRAAAAGVLPLLFELADASEPRSRVLELPGGLALRLVARGEALLSFEGPVALRAASELRARGLLALVPADEAAAQDLLERAVEEGDLDAFAVDQTRRRAAEALLAEAVAAPEARYVLAGDAAPSSPAARQAARWLGRRWLSAAVEGARRRLGREDARRGLAFRDDAALVLDARLRARAAQVGLEAELVRAFERHAGDSVGAFLDALPPEAGGPGALLALGAAGVIRFGGRVGGGGSGFRLEAARARLDRVSAAVAVGDYFALLEVSREASAREVEAAHARLTAGLRRLALAALGLEHREGERQEALAVLDEARDVLLDARLRALYAEALEHGEPGG